MYELEIQNDYNFAVDEALLIAAMTTVLQQENAPEDAAITVVIADDPAVAALNEEFRGVASATDVLSFPADRPPIEIPDEPLYLGDLIIAHPYAKAQAEREGHTLNESLALLVIHGTLHLLGYDHDNDVRKAAMWAAQEQALIKMGISPAIVPALEDADDEH